MTPSSHQLCASKPNILIDEDLRVRLADFGLARFGDSTTATIGSFQGGATRWMSPELFHGAPSTYSSDVYAFGCVCFEVGEWFLLPSGAFLTVPTDLHPTQTLYRSQRGSSYRSINEESATKADLYEIRETHP